MPGPKQGGPWHENMWVHENRSRPGQETEDHTYTQQHREREFHVFVQEAVGKQFALMTDTADVLGDPVQIPEEVSADSV